MIILNQKWASQWRISSLSLYAVLSSYTLKVVVADFFYLHYFMNILFMILLLERIFIYTY